MTPPLIEWADLEGRGFLPLQQSTSEAPPEFWAVAHHLVEDHVVAQPPIRSTQDHPVWSLRRVEVRRLGTHWCFAEQGRAGVFGVAGSCRFQFLSYELEAADAWAAGVEAIGAKQTSDGASPDASIVACALSALLLGQQRVRIPGSPIEVAAAIGAVLRVLPRQIAARYAWSTCLLQEPDPAEWTITGDQPQEFRTAAAVLAKVIDRVPWSEPPSAEAIARKLATPVRQQAFDWLVALAVAGTVDAPLLAMPEPTVLQLVGRIAAERVIPRLEDVPAMLARRGDRQLLAQHGHLVTKWAAEHPNEALDALPGPAEPRLRLALLRGVIDLLISDPAVRDGAALLVEVEPDPNKLAGRIRARMRDGTWQGASASWLAALGISPWEHPDLCPDWLPVILDEVRRQGFTTRVWEVIETDGPRLALEVLQEVRALHPHTAARLISIVAFRPPDAVLLSNGDLMRLGQERLGRVAGDRDAVESWLLAFAADAKEQMPGPALRQVLYGAVIVLLQRTGAWRRAARLKNPRLVGLIENAVAASEQAGDEPIPTALQRLHAPEPQQGQRQTPQQGQRQTPAPDNGRRPRAIGSISSGQRRRRVRLGISSGTAIAIVVGLVLISPVGPLGDPTRETSVPGKTAPSMPAASSSRLETHGPLQASPKPMQQQTFQIHVSWEKSLPAADERVVREVSTQLAPTTAAGRHVTFVVLVGVGQSPAVARKTAEGLQNLLIQQAKAQALPELANAQFFIAEPIKPDDVNKIGVLLTFTSEPL